MRMRQIRTTVILLVLIAGVIFCAFYFEKHPFLEMPEDQPQPRNPSQVRHSVHLTRYVPWKSVRPPLQAPQGIRMRKRHKPKWRML